jgi:hypothetical protein
MPTYVLMTLFFGHIYIYIYIYIYVCVCVCVCVYLHLSCLMDDIFTNVFTCCMCVLFFYM